MRTTGLQSVFLLGAIALGLSGCGSLPTPPAERLLTAETAGTTPAQRLELMRIEQERLSHKRFTRGNAVTLLVNGPSTFTAMAAAINGATDRVDIESYEFDLTVGSQFEPLLLAARRRGVAVHLVYDAWGSSTTPAWFFDRLRKAGIKVLEYNPLRPSDRVMIDLNRRDHRKLLVVDDHTVITGGVNLSKVYENPPGKVGGDPDRMAWRDTDVRIVGPAAAQFEHYYMETWVTQHAKPLPPPPPAPQKAEGDSMVEAIDGAPDQGHPLIYRSLLAAIAMARTSVHLTTGFFVPPPLLVHTLERAARRGVDVRIVVPRHSTSTAAIKAGRSYYGEMLASGIHIYERVGRVLHAKTAVIDGMWSYVGSSNLDYRSVLFNNEIDAVILGQSFGVQMEALFRSDCAKSVEITPAAWRRRGLIERVEELGADVISRVL